MTPDQQKLFEQDKLIASAVPDLEIPAWAQRWCGAITPHTHIDDGLECGYKHIPAFSHPANMPLCERAIKEMGYLFYKDFSGTITLTYLERMKKTEVFGEIKYSYAGCFPSRYDALLWIVRERNKK